MIMTTFCGDNLTFSLKLPIQEVNFLLNKKLSGKYIAVKSLPMRRGNERFLIFFFINNDFVCLVSNDS